MHAETHDASDAPDATLRASEEGHAVAPSATPMLEPAASVAGSVPPLARSPLLPLSGETSWFDAASLARSVDAEAEPATGEVSALETRVARRVVGGESSAAAAPSMPACMRTPTK